jgi:transposase
MYSIAMDVGKYRTYGIVERDGKITKEGYMPTTKEGFRSFMDGIDHATVIVEASSTIDRIASMLPEHEIRVANPMKVKLIAESMKKTDRNDAHILLDLFRKQYMPESYLPSKEIREARNICRNRNFLIRQRTAVKNRIRDQAYRLGFDFKGYTKKNLDLLREASPVLRILVSDLSNLDQQIFEMDMQISNSIQNNEYAKIIDTIPGIGKYGALSIAAEIGNVDRFPREDNIFSYAGLVPRIYQSGSREYKGHITKGNSFLKYMLVECVQIHMRLEPHSEISEAYRRISIRSGSNKAKIAAARHLLRMIYYMLKRRMEYTAYERRDRS